MTSINRATAGFIGLSFLALSSCADGGGTGERGFQNQYAVARNALENGSYAKAGAAYAALIPKSGPLEPRMRLEYAHTLLRAGHFAKASEEAKFLADTQEDTARSAALSVYGTAQHELGMAALAEGDTAAGRNYLLTAKAAIDELLANDPQLDPLGGMAGRQASIRVRLAAL